MFQVTVVPRPEHSLTELEPPSISNAKFSAKVPRRRSCKSEERIGAELSRGLESNLGKANQLINGAVFYSNPGHSVLIIKDLAVTAADVKRVAAQYLSSYACLSVVPKGKKDKASKATEAKQ